MHLAYRSPRAVAAALLAAFGSLAQAQNYSYSGLDTTWNSNDTNSFQLNGGNQTIGNTTSVVFGNVGTTSTRYGITVNGTVNVGDVTFTHTGSNRFSNVHSPAINYYFTGANSGNLVSSGNLTLGQGAVGFNINATFSGALNASGGSIFSLNGATTTLTVGSLAAPTQGNGILFTSGIAGPTATNGTAGPYTATGQRIIITGSAPTTTTVNGGVNMVGAGFTSWTGLATETSATINFMKLVDEPGGGKALVAFTSGDYVTSLTSGSNNSSAVVSVGATTISANTTVHGLRTSGTITISANTVLTVAGGALAFGNTGGGQVGGSGTLQFGSNGAFISVIGGNTRTISTPVAGSGGITIISNANNEGGLLFSNANSTFTGDVNLNTGNLKLQGFTGAQAGSGVINNNNLVIGAMGRAMVTGNGTSSSIGGLSGSGYLTADNQTTAAPVGTNNNTIIIRPKTGETRTFEGVIRDAESRNNLNATPNKLAIVIDGPGVQVFGTGSTVNSSLGIDVKSGTLLANGAFGTNATGALTVRSGATFGRSSLTPLGLNAASAVTFESDSTIALGLSASSTDHASLAANSNWTFASGQKFLFTDVNGAALSTFSGLETSRTYAGIITGLTGDETALLTSVVGWSVVNPDWSGNYVGSFVYNSGGTVDLVVTAIPEPSAFAALAGLGALGLAATRRRHRA